MPIRPLERLAAISDVNPKEMSLTIGVSREMVKRDALAKIDGTFVKGFPVKTKLEIVLEINTNVGTCCHRHEGGRDRPDFETAVIRMVHVDDEVRTWPVEVVGTGPGGRRYYITMLILGEIWRH